MPLFRTRISAPEMAMVLLSIAESYISGKQGLGEFLKDLEKLDNPFNFQTLTEAEGQKLGDEYLTAIIFSIVHACRTQKLSNDLSQSILDQFHEALYSYALKGNATDPEIDAFEELLRMRYEEYYRHIGSQDMFKRGTAITRNLFPAGHHENIHLIMACVFRMKEVTKTANDVMRQYRVKE